MAVAGDGSEIYIWDHVNETCLQKFGGMFSEIDEMIKISENMVATCFNVGCNLGI